MTDFLSNLAARTVTTPTLRPRVPLRFESAADVPAPAFVPEPEGGVEAVPPALAPQSTPAPRATSRAEEFEGSPVSVRMPGPGIPQAGRTVPPVMGATVRPSEVLSASPRAVEPRVHAAETMVPAVRQAREPATGLASRREVIVHPEVTPAPVARRSSRDIVSRKGQTAPIESPAAATNRRTPIEPQRWWMTGEGRLQAGRRQTAVASTVASAQPVVHVSIGRVEIRATPPPAAAARGRDKRPAAAMTIDEYVARRERS